MEGISDHVRLDLYGRVFQLLRQFSSAEELKLFSGNPDYLLLIMACLGLDGGHSDGVGEM